APNAVNDSVAKTPELTIKNPHATIKSHDRIFFTRSQLKGASKSEFGLDMLDDYFRKNGFEIIAPERISLSKMIFLIRNAEVCASISGTLAHNMIFANDQQHLIIIERGVRTTYYQMGINHLRCLKITYIDANFCFYPLYHSPFVFAYIGKLEEFTKDNAYLPADEKYYSKKYLKKLFKDYIKAYQNIYGYQWFMYDWMIEYTDCIYEAYQDSEKYFLNYLNGTAPFKLSHYFKWKYIKQFIKKIIKR
ncbi:MAG: glycosyltransferase family 61 protein, partial [Clostridiales bacterium]|nr:glycosyltransferase family 61 protein [Clostridiales bacterium]